MDEREQDHEQPEATEMPSKASSMHDPETEEDTASGGPADPPDDGR
ncbi:hypothetical protein [Agrococcus sp. ARC_14]|nr:hypothetical protein [Agrococcus sp. ARC_14]MCH1883509.1 hypothetical protein [Agrococcus sp. ARC_14]